ncbi:hypothetical protein [Streptomyces cavernae]|uniref:hypothetical protein n=1 Tax=Streptomyces cavernae TaxID=2259034 RepID=UPI0012D8E7F5
MTAGSVAVLPTTATSSSGAASPASPMVRYPVFVGKRSANWSEGSARTNSLSAGERWTCPEGKRAGPGGAGVPARPGSCANVTTVTGRCRTKVVDSV